NTLSGRLKVLGIDAQRARNATLRDLTQEVDARTLIDLLGYSPDIIAQHAARSATPMSDYIDLKRQQPR
ncbi:recombinase XerD, partial [Kocuria sp. WN036]